MRVIMLALFALFIMPLYADLPYEQELRQGNITIVLAKVPVRAFVGSRDQVRVSVKSADAMVEAFRIQLNFRDVDGSLGASVTWVDAAGADVFAITQVTLFAHQTIISVDVKALGLREQQLFGGAK